MIYIRLHKEKPSREGGLFALGLEPCFGIDMLFDKPFEFFERDGDLVFLAVDAVSDATAFFFLIADDDGVRNLFDLGVPDFVSKFLIGIIHGNSDVHVTENLRDFVSVIKVAVEIDRQELYLNRGEPSGESPAVILDEDADEALDGAEDDAVEHDRLNLLAVLIDVGAAEAVRQVDVELDGPALPCSAHGVLELEV